ncbi:MAG: phospholipase D family protein [Bdellovibrionota bacterium]
MTMSLKALCALLLASLFFISPVEALPKNSDASLENSGFMILDDGLEALHVRLTLIREAKRSLDLQYYIWHQDKAGKLLLSALLDAAERGVKVRLLLDDMNLGDDRDLYRQLDRHPQVEIRLFNPLKFDGKGISKVARSVELMVDFKDKNRRMHNKMLLADSSMAVLGGRNIGDEYFDLAVDGSFRDLDIFAQGPISEELTQTFDSYWKSENSVPFFSDKINVALSGAKSEEWSNLRQDFALDRGKNSGGFLAQSKNLFTLPEIHKQLIWAPADAMADSPEIFSGDAEGVEDQLKDWPEPQKSLLIESAYFIPTHALLKQFQGFLSRSVHIQVLTNSLQSNDVLMAHAGYMGKREDILRMGIDLFEWRRDLNKSGKSKSANPYGSQAGLHSKAFVIDDEYVFIGSVNLDGRSIHLNTESGLMVHSRELARRVTDYIKGGMNPQTSWKISLACPQLPCEEKDKRVLWKGQKGGQELTLDDEPEEGFWLRTSAKILSHLPFKSVL